MVPAPGIRIFRAEEEKRLGADRIDSCEFDGSDHVQHGLVHPEAYWEKVTEVLLKCGVDVPNPNAGRKLAKAKL